MSISLHSEILEKLKSPETLSRGWLLKRLRKLSLQDFSALKESLAQQTYLPLLSAISEDFSIPIDFRVAALQIRESLGDRIAHQEKDLLEEEIAIRQTLSNCFTHEDLEEGPYLTAVIDKLSRLPKALAKTILQDIVKEKGEAGLPFLKIVYQNSAGNYALMALEVLASIVTPESKRILQETAAKGKDKSAQKFAKKLLYRLRDVDLPPEMAEQQPKESAKSILTAPDHNIIRNAWASFIDGEGNRILHLLKTHAMGQMQLITLLVGDTDGIMDCQSVIAPKKTINPAMEKYLSTRRIIEIPATYAIALITAYQEFNKKSGRELPKDFLTILGFISAKKAESEQAPLIYQEIAIESLDESPYFLNRTLALLELEEFGSWLIPPAQLEKYLIKLREIEHSLIIVSEYMQKERIEEVYREVVREFFSSEKRAIYRGRLEEMAYFLWATKRQEEARLALAAAMGLEDMEGDKILEHPFATQLVCRSIEAIKSEAASDQLLWSGSTLALGEGGFNLPLGQGKKLPPDSF